MVNLVKWVLIVATAFLLLSIWLQHRKNKASLNFHNRHRNRNRQMKHFPPKHIRARDDDEFI